MGYQESYIKMKDRKDFDKLLKTIRKNGEEKFKLSTPVEIITLLKPIKIILDVKYQLPVYKKLEKGEKFIYVVGERYGQRSSCNFFEACDDIEENIIENLEIYFTEYFPSYDIFENNNKTKMATHERFKWK